MAIIPGMSIPQAEDLIIKLLSEAKSRTNVRGSLGLIIKTVHRSDFPERIRLGRELAFTEEGILVFADTGKQYTPQRGYENRLSYSNLTDLSRSGLEFKKDVAFQMAKNIERLNLGYPLCTLQPFLKLFSKNGYI
jgi:hypothetical protein